MRQSEPFGGTGVALVTPFLPDKSIDFTALERIIDFVIDGGVDYIVSLGTTGEAITLSSEECRQVLDFTIEKNRGRVPLVAGLFGSNFTDKIVRIIRDYDFKGIDGIMSSSPAYSKPSQEGIFQHYMAIEAVAARPIIIYNVPGRTSSNVAGTTSVRLARASEKFVAVKEASGNFEQIMQVIKNRPEGFLVLSGDDPLTLPLIGCGGDGAISVIANAYPAEFSGMVRAARETDLARARELNERLLDVHPWLYIEGNPSGVKAAMEIRGLCARTTRIPLTALSEENVVHLRGAMQEVGPLKS